MHDSEPKTAGVGADDFGEDHRLGEILGTDLQRPVFLRVCAGAHGQQCQYPQRNMAADPVQAFTLASTGSGRCALINRLTNSLFGVAAKSAKLPSCNTR